MMSVEDEIGVLALSGPRIQLLPKRLNHAEPASEFVGMHAEFRFRFDAIYDVAFKLCVLVIGNHGGFLK